TDPEASGFEIATAATPPRESVAGGIRATFELMPGEELWVIAKGFDQAAPANEEKPPGCGALMAKLPEVEKEVPLPLKHTAVVGNIDGYIATVYVTQQFHNPYNSKIEADYVFPLPDNAAVSEFVMTVGERKIRGIIREREEAEKIYNDARSQGHVASLLTQERPNIFTQKVANIEPGKQIDINIRYFSTLQYDDGAYEFVFPMVVGPRYNPPATTDGIGAVRRGNQGTSGQSTEVQYLTPGERSGHDVSLNLNISAGVNIESVRSINHDVAVKEVTETERSVTLSVADSIPNRDFVLRFQVAGDKIKTAMMTHRDDHGQYFTMMLYPPAHLKTIQRSPMEMVFVLDCSGSMSGRPIEQARKAISHTLTSLTPRDTFQIINFNSTASQLGASPVIATPQNIQKGLAYLNSLNGQGGTEMIQGLKAALNFPHDEGRFRLVSFMTDGYIGNDHDILNALSANLGDSRIFSFGVGQSPNRFLMDRMALIGRGAVAYLSLNDDPVEIMNRFNERISHPAMTDLSIDWGTMNVTDVYPQILPDLIVGRPVVVTGRFTGEPSLINVGGRQGMQPSSFTVAVDATDATKEHRGIASVWARLKITDLMTQFSRTPDQAVALRQSVTQTALEYSLMSTCTAFVAVDSMSNTEGSFGTTVAVPVNVPDGVKYETTVENQ
ncbi:MAG: VIT domain-containing protein, partial [Planctomycetota bacterium]|nr:VIT domain-containing protein [Planctomycetota bacterium]